jgi:hypothetical protein
MFYSIQYRVLNCSGASIELTMTAVSRSRCLHQGPCSAFPEYDTAATQKPKLGEFIRKAAALDVPGIAYLSILSQFHAVTIQWSG